MGCRKERSPGFSALEAARPLRERSPRDPIFALLLTVQNLLPVASCFVVDMVRFFMQKVRNLKRVTSRNYLPLLRFLTG